MKTLRERSFESETAPRRGRRRGRRGGAEEEKSGLDRVLRVHSGSLTFLGMTLGVFVSKKFFMLPLAVAVALAQEYAKDRFLPRSRP